jgi:anti-sigma factor RsiW
MSNRFPTTSPSGLPEDAASRDARHQVLATLLGAYADGELPIETSSQIDAHLLGCARCRSELQVHRALKQRLSHSLVPTASAAFHDRIRSALADAPAPVVATPGTASARISAPRRWIAAAVGLVVIVTAIALALRETRPMLTPPPLIVGDSVAVINRIVDEYRRASRGDLPGRARDLDLVRAAMPFAVNPLSHADAHLVAAWTTAVDGEPVAVLAYRWHETVILQFVVDESLLFRSRELRTAFAAGRAVVRQDGAQGVVVWPDTSMGSVLVGDLAWERLTAIRPSPDR